MDSRLFYRYDFINNYNGHIKPSETHASENATSWYFKRYLIQKIMSVFKFDNIPEHWNTDYFLYTLFVRGFVAIIETDKFGIIPQQCGLQGYDVFYAPRKAIITNPLLSGLINPRIGTECALVRLQPDYGSSWDIVSYYADLQAIATQSLEVNMFNSKLAYVFACRDKNVAESFKKMVDKINQGLPAVFADTKLFDDDGEPLWTTFQNNLKQNYVANTILEDMIKIDARFCSEVGIPNVNMAKTSGVTDNEVEANNVDTQTKVSIWLDTLTKSVNEANKLFGLDIKVSLRFKEEMKKDELALDTGDV